MEEEKKKTGRGGARPGSGRRKEHFKTLSFRAPEYMVHYLEGMERKTEYIRACIDKDMAVQGRELDFSKVGKVMSLAEAEPLNIAYFENSRVVAGFPIPLDNDEKSQEVNLLRMLCPYPESCYLMQVVGNSMIDSDIQDGDFIIVDKSNRNPDEDEVAMCELNGEYTIKYIRKSGERVYLIPANPDYPEIEVGDGDSLYVWGVVTNVIHKPRKK